MTASKITPPRKITKRYTYADALADAGQHVRDATAQRDELVAAAAATGEMSQREIARALGLSHTAVQVILRRAAAA